MNTVQRLEQKSHLPFKSVVDDCSFPDYSSYYDSDSSNDEDSSYDYRQSPQCNNSAMENNLKVSPFQIRHVKSGDFSQIFRTSQNSRAMDYKPYPSDNRNNDVDEKKKRINPKFTALSAKFHSFDSTKSDNRDNNVDEKKKRINPKFTALTARFHSFDSTRNEEKQDISEKYSNLCNRLDKSDNRMQLDECKVDDEKESYFFGHIKIQFIGVIYVPNKSNNEHHRRDSVTTLTAGSFLETCETSDSDSTLSNYDYVDELNRTYP